ncbi:MAG TPA: hypothetical protein PKE20_09660, partial [Promineifilum sp.]|nr:hypothetical protein [Promineifilum sp.]
DPRLRTADFVFMIAPVLLIITPAMGAKPDSRQFPQRLEALARPQRGRSMRDADPMLPSIIRPGG